MSDSGSHRSRSSDGSSSDNGSQFSGSRSSSGSRSRSNRGSGRSSRSGSRSGGSRSGGSRSGSRSGASRSGSRSGGSRSGSASGRSSRSGSRSGGSRSGSASGSRSRSGSRSGGSRSRSRSGSRSGGSRNGSGSRRSSIASSNSAGSQRSSRHSSPGTPIPHNSSDTSRPTSPTHDNLSQSHDNASPPTGSPSAKTYSADQSTATGDKSGGSRLLDSSDEEMPVASKNRSMSDSDGGDAGRGASLSPASDFKRKKAAALLSSDDDGDDVSMKSLSPIPDGELTAGNLFGDASDISDSDSDKSQKNNGIISDDEDAEQVINIQIPKLDRIGSNKYIHFVKMPNFLSLDTRPFEPNAYEDELGEDGELMDEEGQSRLKLKVENTIRWRYKQDENGEPLFDILGDPVRQSNARMIHWSDGSRTLHLGKEIFDIQTTHLKHDFNHLYTRQDTGLQGQAIFRTKLTFRPHSTDSFTHRKIMISMVDRSTKQQKLKVLPIAGVDPDMNRSALIKKEEENLRASIRLNNQQRRLKERQESKTMSTQYLEEDPHSINNIKDQYKTVQQTSKGIYSDSETESSEGKSSSEDESAEEEDVNISANNSGDSSDAAQKTKKKVQAITDSDSDL